MDPVEPTIRYSKTAEATYKPGVPGTLLDVPGAADMVSDAYFQPDAGTLALPMTPVAPQVADKEAERVFAELAQPAVALPVALAVGAENAEIPAADIARTLTFDAQGHHDGGHPRRGEAAQAHRGRARRDRAVRA